LLMSFLNSTKSSYSSYSSSVSSSSSELNVEQLYSSAKDVSILPKLYGLVWETGQSDFSRLTDFASSF
jgi:hypothetical protein